MTSDESDALALAVQAGDAEAFGLLVDTYQERFYRVAYRIVGDPDEALDVVQEAFVKIHQGIGGWDGESRFFSWAYRVVSNLAIDQLRRRGRARRAWEARVHEEGEPVAADLSSAGLVAQEQRQLLGRVQEAIEELPDGQRAIVALRHYEGFSLKEIAEIRGCALGTVKSTLHQAFRSLRQRLGVDLLERVAVGRTEAE